MMITVPETPAQAAALHGDALATVDQRGILLSCNTAAEDMCGYTLSEVAGSHVGALLSEESMARVWRRVRQLAKPEVGGDGREADAWAVTQEALIRRKDGTTCPVDLTITEFRRRHRPVYMVALRDITARKDAERETAAALAAHAMANCELDRLNQLKTEFIAMVSHEFRTALTGIRAFSELIRDNELPVAEVREFADDINTEAVRLTRMITDLLSLEKMESGRMTLTLEQLDLNRLMRDLVDRHQHTAQRHLVTFEPGRLPLVMADRDKLIQATTNLLSNATKYSPEGTEITLSTRCEGGQVRVIVSDRGMGVMPDELERIFDRYHRAENRTTTSVPGIGLGLPIVRQIARLHGGHAWAVARSGGGTAFHIRLPVVVS